MYHKVISAVLAALLLLCLLCGCQGGDSALDSAQNGVIRILVQRQDDQYQVASAFGVQTAKEVPDTAVFVSGAAPVRDADGNSGTVYLLRADCAIQTTPEGLVSGEQLDKSQCIPCTVLYQSPEGSPSLAVLQTAEPVPGCTGLPLAISKETVQIGNPVYALGASYNAGTESTTGIEHGIVSRYETYTLTRDTVSIILHTARLHPSNDGGPLLSEEGAVLGVNTSSYETRQENMYAAISSETLLPILDGLQTVYYMASSGNPYTTLYICIATAGAAGILLVIITLCIRRSTRKKAARKRNQPGSSNGNRNGTSMRSGSPNRAPNGSAQAPSVPRTTGSVAPQQGASYPAPPRPPAPKPPQQAQTPSKGRPQTYSKTIYIPQPEASSSAPRPADPVPRSAPSEPCPAATPVPECEAAPCPPPEPEANIPPQPQQPIAPGFRIQGTSGQYANRRFAVLGTLRIGRDPAQNELLYPESAKGISDCQCVLVAEDDKLTIEDLASLYGTYVNRSRLGPNQPMELHVGDVIWLGYENEAFLVDRRD